jgi:hypothetical protein
VVDDPDAAETPEDTSDPDRDAEATDSDATDSEPFERPIDRFRRSGAGTVIAAGLLGVRDALEGRPEREEPAIVADAPAPTLDHIDIVLDPEHPERSRASVYLPPRDDD